MPAVGLPAQICPTTNISQSAPIYSQSENPKSANLYESYKKFSSTPPDIFLKPKHDSSILINLLDYITNFFWPSKKSKRELKKRTKRPTDSLNEVPSTCKQDMEELPKVFADYHPNKKIGASRLLPSCSGKTFPEIITNGYQILDENGLEVGDFNEGITGFATTDRPKTGFLSLDNPHYVEWQINNARAAGIDGFLV
jgi:hypothetical protein